MFTTPMITTEVENYISLKLRPLIPLRRRSSFYVNFILYESIFRPESKYVKGFNEACQIKSVQQRKERLRGVSPDWYEMQVALFGHGDPDMPPPGTDYSKMWSAAMPKLDAIKGKIFITGTGGELTGGEYFNLMWNAARDKKPQYDIFTPAMIEDTLTDLAKNRKSDFKIFPLNFDKQQLAHFDNGIKKLIK